MKTDECCCKYSKNQKTLAESRQKFYSLPSIVKMNENSLFLFKSDSNLLNRKLYEKKLPPAELKMCFGEQSCFSRLNLSMDVVKTGSDENFLPEYTDAEKTKFTVTQVASRSQSLLRRTASECHPGVLLPKKNLLLRDTSFQVSFHIFRLFILFRLLPARHFLILL